ncbi:hypothetical protein B0H14DRAFT_3607254 [Mycena olivaceomarginata]|nr:hypothetical protein B0H14DRAFT_3607254 [Mycena olivaceomarginata]
MWRASCRSSRSRRDNNPGVSRQDRSAFPAISPITTPQPMSTVTHPICLCGLIVDGLVVPFPMTQPMPLFVSHPSLRINLRILVLFHALHSAVLISWTCCLDAANSAARSGRYRDSCKTHNAQGVQGHLAQALPHPHSVQPVNAPPSPPPTQLRLTSQCTPPSRPPAQGQQAGPSRNPPQHGAIRGARGLARPLSNTWVHQYHNDNVRFDTSKVTRQKVDAIVAKTSNLVVYYSKGQSPLQLQIDVDASQTRLSDHPGLIEGLQINPASWLDLYANLEWKTMQASTYFLLDKHAPTLIRLRPSLLVELDLGDCPNIDKFIGKQSRKRTGTALVSPPKAARTNTNLTPGQSRDVIEIPDSPPTTSTVFPLLVPLVPSSSHAPILSQLQSLPQTASPERKFPDSFYACEHDAAWKKYDALRDSSSGKTSIPAVFSTLFPDGAIYLFTPPHVKQHFVAFGRTEEGSWKSFLVGLRDVEAGRSLVSAAPIPMLHHSPAPTTIVKVEPAPIPAAQDGSILNPPPAQRDPAPASVFGLCDFCDIPLTIAPSAKLTQLLTQLVPQSQLDPTPVNPNHRAAFMPHQSVAYCRQHAMDMNLLPTARANSWPEHINYAGLVLRVHDILPTLQEILENLPECDTFQAALTSEAFKKATGYFGELGYRNISSTIRSLFPAITITVDFAPLSWDALMDQVLIPEAMVCLICEDLDISPELASTVLEESTPFGLVYHSDTLDRDRCVQREKERGKAREQPALPLRVSSPRLTPSPAHPSPSPVPSPLLPPHAVSPHLAPAAWSRSPTPPSPTLDPDAICPYCDQEFPIAPTDTLTAMAKKLSSISWPDPLPEYPHHRTLPQITMSLDHCARHRFERDLIPAAIAGNWPFAPDFAHLFHRILDLGPTLRNLSKNLDQSHFCMVSRQYYGNKLTQLSSLGHQYLSNRVHGSAYYGERGYQLLDLALRFIFPGTFDISNFRPLTYDIVLREVLIPEATIRLIQQDMGITLDAAIVVLENSDAFGRLLHPSDNDCRFYNAALSTIARSHRRTQWGLRTWEASGSPLDFHAWLQNQWDTEDAMAVKVEHIDQLIPAQGSNHVDWSKVNLHAPVIDLTDL